MENNLCNIMESKINIWTIATLFAFFYSFNAFGQESKSFSISEIKSTSEEFNRAVNYGDHIYLGRAANDGFLKISGINFKNGVIEADVKGSDTPQQSFVGIAFHGADNETYEAVYFRPFNFRNPERSGNSVQYIAHPEYPWQKLRTENPGQYESKLNQDLDPDEWFHVRLQILDSEVKVFVNDYEQPTLTVQRLNNNSGGWIGFWVGNSSDGWFKNLKIIHPSNCQPV